ncbi:filamentous hemagglutinin N-terminal domain-containing protein [Aliarcobacter cryaerophilus]|uniref:two-partner secretion domain-containing protein n=1 Tax=Aliarcobacter cryaerophilus TaxID=28198 RepID=UPI0021B61935|nr:filamentous hemagglutinin N-terminal domain-containing protein [Aliarcobacter cryaerophilus]MCT7523563.1 filamentous hemagglutinin N-terminal domain-containing protein [Aliarcobacter cryaerophilus]
MYYKNRFCTVIYSVISLVVASNLYGAPTGGTVVSGNATISQNGNTTNINQSSNKAIINWQDFSIKSNETVNFNQPNSNSITLNRVIGNEKSIIDGALNANGQVWLINSNGVLFGKNAKINTSGILVTTKNLSDKDFQDGKYSFKGDSKATIENLGEINSQKYASFIANSVINNGTIKVHTGNINLIGASEFTVNLDENSNISLKVDKGVLDALVENNHLLIANGGNVYLTTNAKNELLKGVVNNTGIIEAASLDDLTQSEVIIFAHGGTANIDGEINAKGSFVETSGEKLSVKDSFKIEAKTWLLDPTNITIGSSGTDVNVDGSNITPMPNDVTVSALSIMNALKNAGVYLRADENIYVNETISYDDFSLNLFAGNSIYINRDINVTGTGKLNLHYGQSSQYGATNDNYYVNAKVNLADGTGFLTQKGTDGSFYNWTIINSAVALQNMKDGLYDKYVLGSDINLSGFDWIAVGSSTNYPYAFGGYFDGLGHTISNLTINKPTTDNQGLFGVVNNLGVLIRNVGLVDVNIIGQDNVGGLVGYKNSGTIENSYVTGTVNGKDKVGGLVGLNSGSDFSTNKTIENSYFSGEVSGTTNVGGLVGTNSSSKAIKNSYASATVSGTTNVGGLVGNNSGTIENSFYNSTKYSGFGLGTGTSTGVTGLTLAQLQDVNTFRNAGWSIEEDNTLIKGTPIFKGGKWVIGTYVVPQPEPTPPTLKKECRICDIDVTTEAATINYIDSLKMTVKFDSPQSLLFNTLEASTTPQSVNEDISVKTSSNTLADSNDESGTAEDSETQGGEGNNVLFIQDGLQIRVDQKVLQPTNPNVATKISDLIRAAQR